MQFLFCFVFSEKRYRDSLQLILSSVQIHALFSLPRYRIQNFEIFYLWPLSANKHIKKYSDFFFHGNSNQEKVLLNKDVCFVCLLVYCCCCCCWMLPLSLYHAPSHAWRLCVRARLCVCPCMCVFMPRPPHLGLFFVGMRLLQ